MVKDNGVCNSHVIILEWSNMSCMQITPIGQYGFACQYAYHNTFYYWSVCVENDREPVIYILLVFPSRGLLS